MRLTLLPIAQLLLAVGLLEAGAGLQGVLVPIRAQTEGFSTPVIGVLGSAYYLGLLAGCLLIPALIRRVGHIRAFSGLACLVAATFLLYPIIVWEVAWAVLRVGIGFGFAGLYIVVESWLNYLATAETRGRILGAYMLTTWLALVLGKLMFGWWEPTLFVPFALVGVLTCLAVMPVAFTTMTAPPAEDPAPPRMSRLAALSPLGLAGAFGIGLTNATFWSLAPLFAEAHGFTHQGVALFMALTVLGGAATQWPLGKWSDLIDRRWVIAGACLAASTLGAALVLSFRAASDTVILALGFGFGAAALPLYALFIAHANDQAPNRAFTEVSSTLLLMYSAGAVLGPMAGSAVMERAGPMAMFGFTAAVHGGLLAYTLWRLKARAPVPPAEKADFVAVPKTTQAAIPLDPRVQPAVAEAAAAASAAGAADPDRSA